MQACPHRRVARPGHGGSMTILAAYDPQTLDRAPIRFAVAAARFANVPLVIASVRAGMTPSRVRLWTTWSTRSWRACAADLARDRAIDVRTRVVGGLDAGGRGARTAARDRARSRPGFVVVGSTKRGVIGQIAPGTTAQRVINGCACPVVVVPNGHNPPQRLSSIGVGVRSDAGGSPRAARRRHHRPDGRRRSARPHRGEARDRRRCLRRPGQGRRRAQPRRARSHGRRRHRRAHPRRTSGERGAGR